MKAQLEQRLDALRAEHEAGLKMRADLEQQSAALRETLLRISGAIQVLEEELGHPETPPANGAAPMPEHANGAAAG